MKDEQSTTLLRSAPDKPVSASAVISAVSKNVSFPHLNVIFGLFSVLLVLANAGTIREVIRFALDLHNSHASQILMVPFVSAWLLWTKRKAVFHNPRPSVLPGLAVMGLGALLFLYAKTAGDRLSGGDQLSLMTTSVVVLWLGGFLLTYGSTAFRTALFPLLFLFFAVPIPRALLDRVIRILQVGSAEVAYVLIKLSGIPVYRQGFIFAMPNLVVEVTEACSGIRSAIAIFISGLIAGHVFLQSTWKKLLLMCVAIPVLFFKNAVRIAVLSVIAVHWDKRVMTSSLHTDGGVLFFALGLCLLYRFLLILAKPETHTQGSF